MGRYIHELFIRVKDENTLLPNQLFGEYHLTLDKNLLYDKYKENPNYVLQDGYVNLENCSQGQLDIQILFKFCNEFEPKLEFQPQEQQSSQFVDQSSMNQQEQQVSNTSFDQSGANEAKFEKMDGNEVHVLPTIHVKDKPIITEKEVEYTKPIEIKETVIHQEKPIIVEQPIIKEKHNIILKKHNLNKIKKKLEVQKFMNKMLVI